jgi:hypothetical protein
MKVNRLDNIRKTGLGRGEVASDARAQPWSTCSRKRDGSGYCFSLLYVDELDELELEVVVKPNRPSPI